MSITRPIIPSPAAPSEIPLRTSQIGIGLLEETSKRIKKRTALIQFIVDWNHAAQQDKESMLDAPPDNDGLGNSELAAIAVVIRSLCERDLINPPEWVYGVKSDREETIHGLSIRNLHTHHVKKKAPVVCHEYKVYFQPWYLDLK